MRRCPAMAHRRGPRRRRHAGALSWLAVPCAAVVAGLAVGLCSAAAGARADPDTVISATSHLGHVGPQFAPGMTPSALGWGSDDQAYPDRFVVNPQDGAEMAWMPPGEFEMGTPEALAVPDGPADEQPVHRVRITAGFWMYRHEVTNEQYRAFRPSHDSGEYRGISVNADRMPVASVDWDGAGAYCRWAGGRLPTEAEWEYACRAGQSRRHTWGDSEAQAGRYASVADITAQVRWSDFVVFDTDDGIAAATAVGMFPPNDWGLHDMLGNVWEWCSDWYARDYYARSPVEDPQGPEQGSLRVLRGGSWFSPPVQTRCTARFAYYPSDICPGRGFRVCVVP